MCSETCIRMCMDTYFHQLHCLIFAFRLHAQPAVAHIDIYASQLVCCSGRRAPRAGGSRTGRVTRVRRRWCDAREKEVAGAACVWFQSLKSILETFGVEYFPDYLRSRIKPPECNAHKVFKHRCPTHACLYTYATIKGDRSAHAHVPSIALPDVYLSTPRMREMRAHMPHACMLMSVFIMQCLAPKQVG